METLNLLGLLGLTQRGRTGCRFSRAGQRNILRMSMPLSHCVQRGHSFPPVPIISPNLLHRPALRSLNRIWEESSEPERRLRGWCEGVPEFASAAIGAGTALSSTASRLLHLVLSLLLHSLHLVQNMRI